MSAFYFRKYGDRIAQIFACEYRVRGDHFYRIYLAADDANFRFTPADLASWPGASSFLTVMADPATPVVAIDRGMELTALLPINP